VHRKQAKRDFFPLHKGLWMPSYARLTFV